MTPEQWQRVRSVFQQAVEAPASERAAMIDQQCADDAELRRQVERMLRHHDNAADDFLESPLSTSEHKPVDHDSDDPLVGRHIGQFRVQRRLAVGGMGVVYKAEQDNPRRAAAVKVLHPGRATPAALRRFEYETQVLGQLQHPGIARIFEAGTFDIGAGAQPYFAMEFIDGLPLTDFANQYRLPTEDRLRLMVRLSQAVQYAHQRGVVHRDLKPANILVETNSMMAITDVAPSSETGEHSGTTSDASPQPKILDFGVARAIDSDIQATTMHTSAGELVGTLNYMSPEQVSGDPEAVDSLTDVYALGLIGYELLTGRLPYDQTSGTAPEAVRAIAEQPPRPLSAIERTFRGDLDTIFRTALEKDPSRRYQSAGEFGADLQRFLANEPISARPPSALYQLRKFSQRNKALVGGVLATLVALAAGTVLFAWQAFEARASAADARNQQQQAAAVSSFLLTIFERIDPHNAGKDVNVRQLIDHAAADIPMLFAGQRLSEAAVHNEVGTIYYNLSLAEEALFHFSRSLEIWSDEYGLRHDDTLKAANNAGLAHKWMGNLDEAIRLLHEAVEGRAAVLGPTHDDTLISMNNLAMAYVETDNVDEAERLLRETLTVQEQVLPLQDERTQTTKNNLANLLHDRGESDAAEAMLRDVVHALRQKYGDLHPTTLRAIGSLAGLLEDRDVLDESQSLFEEQVAGMRRELGAAHRDTATAHANLALVHEKQDDFARAAAMYGLAADGYEAFGGPDLPQAVAQRYRSAHNHRRSGDFEQAAEAYVRVAEAYTRRFGDEHDRTLRALDYCRRMLRDAGRRVDALPYARRVAAARRTMLGDEHEDTIIAIDNHGLLLLDVGRYEEALPLYEELVQLAATVFDDGDWKRGVALGNLGACLMALNRLDEAEAPLRESLDLFIEGLGEGDDRTVTARQRWRSLEERRSAPQDGDGSSVRDMRPIR